MLVNPRVYLGFPASFICTNSARMTSQAERHTQGHRHSYNIKAGGARHRCRSLKSLRKLVSTKCEESRRAQWPNDLRLIPSTHSAEGEGDSHSLSSASTCTLWPTLPHAHSTNKQMNVFLKFFNSVKVECNQGKTPHTDLWPSRRYTHMCTRPPHRHTAMLASVYTTYHVITIKIHQWTPLVGQSRGAQQKSCHATDLTQEIYWG